ncbi:class I lanthipeptide [Chitinophaga varians]|uniref:class I lanthipeptide n=1 Tax=Chitinophaga varians TaxID=2202339 RepID=UPI001660025B|nr:class I lanthipeptide [Chitinophaga varians]MBC9909526.1 class I lanthipeptide [Chitinophaga varians]
MKKKISISKKLAFNKAAVAVLSDPMRNLIMGGAPITNQPQNCTTIVETCQTSPRPGYPCENCGA